MEVGQQPECGFETTLGARAFMTLSNTNYERAEYAINTIYFLQYRICMSRWPLVECCRSLRRRGARVALSDFAIPSEQKHSRRVWCTVQSYWRFYNQGPKRQSLGYRTPATVYFDEQPVHSTMRPRTASRVTTGR